MSSVNRVTILGNLGADPETRHTQAGTAITNFRVATSERWKDKNSGEQKEQTEWHSVVCFGRLAEIASEYLRKGSKVYVEGQLRTSSWESDGQTRYKTEINAREMKMLDPRSESGGGQQGGGQRSSQQGGGQRSSQQGGGQRGGGRRSAPPVTTPEQLDEDDLDIPF